MRLGTILENTSRINSTIHKFKHHIFGIMLEDTMTWWDAAKYIETHMLPELSLGNKLSNFGNFENLRRAYLIWIKKNHPDRFIDPNERIKQNGIVALINAAMDKIKELGLLPPTRPEPEPVRPEPVRPEPPKPVRPEPPKPDGFSGFKSESSESKEEQTEFYTLSWDMINAKYNLILADDVSANVIIDYPKIDIFDEKWCKAISVLLSGRCNRAMSRIINGTSPYIDDHGDIGYYGMITVELHKRKNNKEMKLRCHLHFNESRTDYEGRTPLTIDIEMEHKRFPIKIRCRQIEEAVTRSVHEFEKNVFSIIKKFYEKYKSYKCKFTNEVCEVDYKIGDKNNWVVASFIVDGISIEASYDINKHDLDNFVTINFNNSPLVMRYGIRKEMITYIKSELRKIGIT